MTALDHPTTDQIELPRVLQALADPVRLAIVRVAGDRDDLPCAAFFEDIPRSTMSHHWRVLREAGIIRQRNVGTKRLNTLRRNELQERFPGLLISVLNAAQSCPTANNPRPHEGKPTPDNFPTAPSAHAAAT